MTTADLIERVAAEQGFAKDHARKIIDSALAAIAATAASGEVVALAGFGRWFVLVGGEGGGGEAGQQRGGQQGGLQGLAHGVFPWGRKAPA